MFMVCICFCCNKTFLLSPSIGSRLHYTKSSYLSFFPVNHNKNSHILSLIKTIFETWMGLCCNLDFKLHCVVLNRLWMYIALASLADNTSLIAFCFSFLSSYILISLFLIKMSRLVWKGLGRNGTSLTVLCSATFIFLPKVLALEDNE